ncbi:Gfo/Idh/MocA family oxidoreductase [Algoriphagus halophytocola]|uniref:Gfo/Idh/MocA family oxidoreductase n=1 Tax=Algoriphagus halophytocola TaxID=2991499 RepID=A0ABY6ML41_9BACT|nr:MULTISPECIES: Gfo/Idh/MocA family oxidoreductase [unclassified Algoriphagus]UZD24471.1 Gfo/Idh/MocA family oxidoreductase [Algoriphagus sp. TR-M5]WBL41835.1 Gfo/Idh/MocA family oxidoreductase [Algoriphagus sp. TR-M9]
MSKIQDNEVRWGILGVGNVCEVKSAPAMNLIPHSKIEAVMRRSEDKVKDYANRHGISKWYTSAKSLINDPQVNAIYIATPPKAHLQLAKMSASAGKPVYVEKPMARTHSECLEMIDACEQAGVPLYVAYYRRELPHFLKIKELIDTGALGEIRTVHINLKQKLDASLITKVETNWRVDPELAGGGYFFDLASHQLDLMDFFFGKITHANGFSSNQAHTYEAEDIVTGSFVFETGVLGSGNWCFTTSEKAEIDETIIYGSKATVRFETFGKGEFTLESDGKGKEIFSFDLPKHIQQPLIKTIVEDLLGSGFCNSTGNSGARANWVMDQLVKESV